MALKPLEIIKKGLKVLKNRVKVRKETLQAQLEALLNPPEESQMMDGARDEEICQAVLVARNAHEEGPINDVEDDSPFEPCPTHHEVFQAAIRHQQVY